MSSLNRWVSDSLIDLVGAASNDMCDFVIAQARSSRDYATLLSVFKTLDVPVNDSSRRFAYQLLDKLQAGIGGASSGKSATSASAPAKPRPAISISSMGEDEGVGGVATGGDAQGMASKATAGGFRTSIRKRTDDDEAADGGDAEDTLLVRKRPKEEALKLTPEMEAERQRLQDLRERDEFAKRMVDKDKEKDRKSRVVPHLSLSEQLDEKERTHIARSDEDRKLQLDESRLVSRQEYLVKREEKKLRELVADLEDEAFLFPDAKLTAKELKDLQYKREVLELVKQRDAITVNDDHYRMPDSYDDAKGRSAKYKVLDNRYEENKDVVGPKDSETYEQEQIDKNQMRSIADYKQKSDNYEFLIDDQIDFVRDALGIEGIEEMQQDPKVLIEQQKAAERMSMAESRAKLPVYAYRESLLDAIDKYQILIIEGETGSGKTTQIPQYLLEHGWGLKGKIACTQPRRVAAMSVAKRVSDEMGTVLGKEVGYRIRFEDCTCDDTVLEYMTDGMMLRTFLGEPDLAAYSVIMIDEAHERTLHTDILLGLVKDVCRFRPELKLLISSASLAAEKFSEYFGDAPVFKIPGRRFFIDIYYAPAPEANPYEACVITTLQIHVTQPPGDILIFLPGQEEIEQVREDLEKRTKGLMDKIGELLILPIYSSLPSDQQAKIFEATPPGARKVVIATNIAETSLTIDGIVYVIDPGLCKQKSYNPRTGVESLQVTTVSKAAAMQRAGRAGRTQPGKCFRLYTALAYKSELPNQNVPEIQRTNLANVCLVLKSLGIEDLAHFDFLDPPPPETIMKALEQLYALGALNAKGELTKTGRRMAEFPLEPMMSKMLLASETYNCSEEIAIICSMLTVGNAIFYKPIENKVHAETMRKNFSRGAQGDHCALLNVFNQWKETNFSTQWCFENFVQPKSMKKARDILDQLLGLFERVELEIKSSASDTVAIRKAILAGYFYNTAQLQKSGNFRTIKKKATVYTHPDSALFQAMPPPNLVVYHEIARTTKDYMRTSSEIERDWLMEIAPHLYKPADLEELTQTKGMPKVVGKAELDRRV
jgi:pre-mRNA-splicing factor ATP-dependent RNA helicase DHX16